MHKILPNIGFTSNLQLFPKYVLPKKTTHKPAESEVVGKVFLIITLPLPTFKSRRLANECKSRMRTVKIAPISVPRTTNITRLKLLAAPYLKSRTRKYLIIYNFPSLLLSSHCQLFKHLFKESLNIDSCLPYFIYLALIRCVVKTHS